MPLHRLALILVVVLLAAALTLWLLSFGGAGLLAAALPAFLIAAVAIRVLRR